MKSVIDFKSMILTRMTTRFLNQDPIKPEAASKMIDMVELSDLMLNIIDFYGSNIDEMTLITSIIDSEFVLTKKVYIC